MSFRNMQVNILVGGFFVYVFLACAWSAPLQNPESKDVGFAPPQIEKYVQIAEQERELENLAGQKQNSMDIEESHSLSYTNNNGKETSFQNSEKTVINPENDELVADIKQTLTKPENGESRVETDIDIPPEGIHEKYIDTGNSESVESSDNSRIKDTIEFTPHSVALYLARTGAFEEFQRALEELVNTSMMTTKEAEQYENEVFDEYTRLIQNVEQDIQYPDDEPYYGYPYDMPEVSERDRFAPAEDDLLYSQYAIPEYGDSYPDVTKEEGRALLNAAMRKDEALDMMIREMVNEWLMRGAMNEEKFADSPLETLQYQELNAMPNEDSSFRHEVTGDTMKDSSVAAKVADMNEKESIEQSEKETTNQKATRVAVPEI